DTASPRSVAAYVLAPLTLAVVVDRVVAVIRRHVLAGDEPLPVGAPRPRRGPVGAAGRPAGPVRAPVHPRRPRNRPRPAPHHPAGRPAAARTGPYGRPVRTYRPPYGPLGCAGRRQGRRHRPTRRRDPRRHRRRGALAARLPGTDAGHRPQTLL